MILLCIYLHTYVSSHSSEKTEKMLNIRKQPSCLKHNLTGFYCVEISFRCNSSNIRSVRRNLFPTNFFYMLYIIYSVLYGICLAFFWMFGGVSNYIFDFMKKIFHVRNTLAGYILIFFYWNSNRKGTKNLKIFSKQNALKQHITKRYQFSVVLPIIIGPRG